MERERAPVAAIPNQVLVASHASVLGPKHTSHDALTLPEGAEGAGKVWIAYDRVGKEHVIETNVALNRFVVDGQPKSIPPSLEHELLPVVEFLLTNSDHSRAGFHHTHEVIEGALHRKLTDSEWVHLREATSRKLGEAFIAVGYSPSIWHISTTPPELQNWQQRVVYDEEGNSHSIQYSSGVPIFEFDGELQAVTDDAQFVFEYLANHPGLETSIRLKNLLYGADFSDTRCHVILDQIRAKVGTALIKVHAGQNNLELGLLEEPLATWNTQTVFDSMGQPIAGFSIDEEKGMVLYEGKVYRLPPSGQMAVFSYLAQASDFARSTELQDSALGGSIPNARWNSIMENLRKKFPDIIESVGRLRGMAYRIKTEPIQEEWNEVGVRVVDGSGFKVQYSPTTRVVNVISPDRPTESIYFSPTEYKIFEKLVKSSKEVSPFDLKSELGLDQTHWSMAITNIRAKLGGIITATGKGRDIRYEIDSGPAQIIQRKRIFPRASQLTRGEIRTKFAQNIKSEGKTPLTKAGEYELGIMVQNGQLAEEILAAYREGQASPHERLFDGTKVAQLSEKELEELVAVGLYAKEVFVISNRRLVSAMVARYYGGNIKQLSLSEDALFIQGLGGLERAVEKFDPRKGFKFSTYSTWHIRERMQKFLQNERRLRNTGAVSLDAEIGEEIDGHNFTPSKEAAAQLQEIEDRLASEMRLKKLSEMFDEAGLTDEERRCLVEVEMRGRSKTEVAEEFDFGDGTVTNRIKSAVTKFNEHFSRKEVLDILQLAL